MSKQNKFDEGDGTDRQIWPISQFPKSPYLQLSSIANHTLPFWPSAKKAVDGKNRIFKDRCFLFLKEVLRLGNKKLLH